MKRFTCAFGFIALWAVSLILSGCSDSKTGTPDTNADNAYVTPIPITWKRDITETDIAGLKWLEGTWRGTGENQEPFYERYTLEARSLTVDSFADGTLETVTDTTRYALINGEFRYTDSKSSKTRRVAASEITPDHIQFIPVVGGGNSYRFERQPGGRWRAVLEWPATNDKAAKQVIYNMEPYKK